MKGRFLVGVLALMVVMVAATFMFGCVKKVQPVQPKEAVSAEFKGAPDWVVKGCYAYWGDKKGGEKKICGLGSAGGSRNISLLREAALARARTDISFQLTTKVKAMVKDYQSTATGGQDFGISVTDEQYVEVVSKQLTDNTLVGVEQADSWQNEKTGTLWVFAVMDAGKFKDLVNQMKGLSESLRKAIVERADKAFEELEQEVEKERKQEEQ